MRGKVKQQHPFIQDYSIITLNHIFFFRLNLSCCSDGTIPIEKRNIKVKANLKEQMQSGKYNLGLAIVLQTFEKISVKDNNKNGTKSCSYSVPTKQIIRKKNQ